MRGDKEKDKMKEDMRFCPNCGKETNVWNTNRYLCSGEAVCDCKKCGFRLSSSKDWGKKK